MIVRIRTVACWLKVSTREVHRLIKPSLHGVGAWIATTKPYVANKDLKDAVEEMEARREVRLRQEALRRAQVCVDDDGDPIWQM